MNIKDIKEHRANNFIFPEPKVIIKGAIVADDELTKDEKIAFWMGETSQSIKNIESNHKQQCDRQQRYTETDKEERVLFRETLIGIKVQLSNKECPHDDEIKKCIESRGRLDGARKWIYGGFGLVFTTLGYLIKTGKH